MAWWRRSRESGRLSPRYATRSRLPDFLPAILWRRGTVLLGDRLHFCVAHSVEGPHRSIEWKSYDWLIGRRVYAGDHAERQPNRFDDPDSYEQ